MIDFQLLSEQDVFSKPSKIVGKYDNNSFINYYYNYFNGAQYATSTHAINDNILLSHNFDEHSELMFTDLYTGVKEVIDYSSSLYNPETVTDDAGEEFTSIESKESIIECIISYENIFYFAASETLVFYKYIDGEKKTTYYRSSNIYSIDKEGGISHIKKINEDSLSGLRDFIKNDDGFYLLYYNKEDESNFVTKIFDDDFNKLYEIVEPFTEFTEYNPNANVKYGRSPRYFLGNANELGFVYTLSEFGDIEKLEIATGERENVISNKDLRSLDVVSYLSGGPVYNRSSYGFFIFDNTTLDIYVYVGNSDESDDARFSNDLQLENLEIDIEYYLIKLTDPYLIYGSTKYLDGSSAIQDFSTPKVKTYFSEILNEAYTEFHSKVDESFKSDIGVYSVVLYSIENLTDITVEAIGIQGSIPKTVNKVVEGVTKVDLLNLEKPSAEISTAYDLFNIRYNTAQNYNLVNDIDLENYILPTNLPDYSFEKEITLREGDFPPIRDVYDIYNAFKLEGNNFKIKNHNFKNQSVDNVGLFLKIGSWEYQNSGVNNLELVDSVINGNSIAGSLAGTIFYGSILNVQASGEVIAEGETGGLVGYINSNMVNINKCSFMGAISGTYSGGLVGSGGGTFENCFVRGIVEGTSSSGGICGGYWSSGTVIKNSFFAGMLEGSGETAPIAVDWGFDDEAIKNCYYNSELLNLEEFTYENGIPRTTEEMTYSYDEENTYIDWDFENVWGIRKNQNDGYPNFNLVLNLICHFSAKYKFEIKKVLKNYVLWLVGSALSTHSEIDIKSNLPIVRTNSSYRENDRLYMSGTLLSPGPFVEEMINRDISGFFQYASEMFELGDFALNKTSSVRLPDMNTFVYSAELATDVGVEDTEIELVSMPSEFEIAPESDDYKYLLLYDGNKQEQIGYSQTDGNSLKQIDRGIMDSRVISFSAGDTAYRMDIETSFTWEDSMFPAGVRTDYKYRAGVEIDSYLRSTGQSYTFTVYGGERVNRASEETELTDLDRGELFLDARDLDTTDKLLDRAKLKFEEFDFEGWQLEEFKEWVWDEFKSNPTLYFDNMTLAELIKIAAGITHYIERDLVNNYNRDEIEQIISDKLYYNTTAADINSWAFDVSKLVARLLTNEPSGAYNDWTENEVKDLLKAILTNEFSFGNFEDNFPFDKWESMMEAKLNISINRNTSIEVEYNQYGPYNYMIDFNLGDIVIVEYPGVFRAMTRIIEVKEEHTVDEGKKYTLTLGKEFETLIGKLKSDKDSISGRL